MTLDEAVLALRAAGCVYAEDEAEVIWETFADAETRARAVADRGTGRPLEQVVGWASFGPVRVTLAPGVFVPRQRAEAILAPAVAMGPRARVVVVGREDVEVEHGCLVAGHQRHERPSGRKPVVGVGEHGAQRVEAVGAAVHRQRRLVGAEVRVDAQQAGRRDVGEVRNGEVDAAGERRGQARPP